MIKLLNNNVIDDINREIADFAFRFGGKKDQNKIADGIEDLLQERYSQRAMEKLGEKTLKSAAQLHQINSDYRALQLLGLLDQLELGITNTGRQAALDGMLTTKSGAIKEKSRENVRRILTMDNRFKGRFRWNEFTEQAECFDPEHKQFKPVEDKLIYAIADSIEVHYRYTPPSSAVKQGISLAAQSNSYNPVKDRIESVHWDGKPRAATFFIDYLGADDNAYVRAVTATWLVGLIARVYRPGIKFDMVPVLAGKQGIGKSSLVANLCDPRYFDDSLETLGATKDDLIKVHSKWLIEIGELEAMNKTSISRVKSFVTATSDNYRAPYGITVQDHPRKMVFIGTVNKREFLYDLTGNRRFFPIYCDIERARKAKPRPGDFNNPEILQVLAEAKVLFDKGHPLMLSEEMTKVAKQKQEEARSLDLQAEQIKAFSELLVPDDWDTFSIYQRQRYWQRVRESGEYSEYKDGRLVNFDVDQLHRLDQFSTSELLQVVFEKETKLLTGGRNSLTDKVSMVLDGNPQWKSSNHCKLFDKELRGYKRV